MKIILTCHVLPDGVGDFQHLLDIYTYLMRDEETKNHEYVVVITFSLREHEAFLQQKMSMFNMPKTHIYLSLDDEREEKFLSQPVLLEHLKRVDQIVSISSDWFIFFQGSPFYEYINPKVVHKFLGEHERVLTYREGVLCSSLGLGSNCYGIKIAPMNKITFIQAFDIFKNQDSQFARDLLLKTGCFSAQTFSETHQLIPVYFNRSMPLYGLLLLLSINKTISKGKNIVLYSSGDGLHNMLKEPKLFCQPFLKDSHIKEIQVLHRDPTEKSKQIYVNPKGQQIIYILHGYKISDASYHAIYQQGEMMAGVSGDNSFEKALSAQILPYYHSTNERSKRNTLIGLSAIIEKKIHLPDAIKKELLFFFKNLDAWNTLLFPSYQEFALTAAEFATINFEEISKAWPLVTEHLAKYYNFYDQLPAIINDKPSFANIDTTPDATIDVYSTVPRVRQSPQRFFARGTPIPNSTKEERGVSLIKWIGSLFKR